MKRLLLLLVVLVAIALALWWWRDLRVLGGGTAPLGNDAAIGYESLDAELLQTGPDGAPSLQLRAARIVRSEAGAAIELVSPAIQYTVNAGGQWQVSAERGRYDPNAQQLQLGGNVQARGRLQGGPDLIIRTGTLQMDLQRQQVTSAAAVLVDRGAYRLSACGLRADLPRRRLLLESRVMVKALKGAPELAALALLCASAAATTAELAPPLDSAAAATCADGSRAEPSLYSGPFEAVPNKIVMRDVVITQCDTRVQAQRAEATDIQFSNAEWRLSGAVVITVGAGTLKAESAELRFVANRIASALVSGNPATFEQSAEPGKSAASGHAARIEYQAGQDEVVLSGAAQLLVGRAEVNVERVRYSISARRIQADGDGSETGRVQMRIQSPSPEPGKP